MPFTADDWLQIDKTLTHIAQAIRRIEQLKKQREKEQRELREKLLEYSPPKQEEKPDG